MKTVQITKVERIASMGLTVLHIGNKPNVLRTDEQLLADINGSFITPREVTSMNDPQVRDVLRTLRGGTLMGDITHVKAGDKWTVTAESRVMREPKAKGFGQYQVGDQKEYEKDATIINDGFLTLDLNRRAYEETANANAYARERVAMADAFDFNGGSSVEPNATATQPEPAPAVEGNDEDDFPETDAAKAAMATEEKES